MLGCGCLLAMGAAFAPRLVLIFMWIVGPRVNAAFKSWIVPLLGLIFLPYTTIMYVLVWSPATGVSGWDWIWVLLGVGLDIMKWGQIANKRKEIPGYPKEVERAMTASGPRPTEAQQLLTPDQEAELEKLEDLRDKGGISGEEYLAKKREIEGYE
jgi:hypothetical protein